MGFKELLILLSILGGHAYHVFGYSYDKGKFSADLLLTIAAQSDE